VLYGKLRPYLRKAFAPDFEGVSATDLLPLLPDENNLDRKFLVWLLLSPQVIEYVVGKQAGVKMPRLRSNDLAQMPIPVPVLTEQQRIVSKIESLFEQSRTARAALTRVPVLMSQFRLAVLASAILGRLTEEWREEQGIKEQWSETDIQSVASVSTGSTPLRSNKTFYSGEGTPWITSAATGKPFITSAQEFVTESAIKAHRLKLYPVGTILVAMYGEGKTRGQVSELAIEATINQACAAIIVDSEKIEKSYLILVFQANYFEIRELAEGGSQPNLNLTKIKEFTFLLPSLGEQKEIVRRIETLFAQADIIEQAASVSLRRAEQVDQSILARAFRGELG
jgi:type I restriction enzyme, S subunit